MRIRRHDQSAVADEASPGDLLDRLYTAIEREGHIRLGRVQRAPCFRSRNQPEYTVDEIDQRQLCCGGSYLGDQGRAGV